MLLFLDYLLFHVVMRFPKVKLSEVNFVLGFSLRLAFYNVSSLTTSLIDMHLWKTHFFKSLSLKYKDKLYVDSWVWKIVFEYFVLNCCWIWVFRLKLLLNFHAGRHGNLSFQELRKYRNHLVWHKFVAKNIE